MASHEVQPGFSFPEQFWTPEWKRIFTPELIHLLINLHREFSPARKSLLAERATRQEEYDQGKLPSFLDRKSEAVTGNWKVSALPPELLCRRVEITGPVNSAKMVINMLSRNEEGARADMAMLDFEDSLKPSFQNILDGYKNVIGAVSGNLSYQAPSSFNQPGKSYKLDPNDMAYVMVRCRGLHLAETNIKVDGEAMPAGLLDLAVCFFHTAALYLAQNKTPKYYIPKCEHHLEARWWNKLFVALENALNIPVGKLKATFLIETLPATFQVEEILFEIKEHAAGLNVGRWDKIFSDIKVLRNHPDRILADRSSINMQKTWMENYAKRVITICHDRGAFAMGGMSAFTPGKSQVQREEQTAKVAEDKQREASWGHDGCWVSHPFFIGTAMAAFKFNNQLHIRPKDFDKYSDILPQGGGPYTLQGLRTNVRVGIAYQHGWNSDIGCVAFDDLMEDLATLEISRAQTWQWLHHQITLLEGMKVTKALVHKIFDEELEKISSEIKASPEELLRARSDAERIFLQEHLPEFMPLNSEAV
ncbi:MAG: malate synthase A [Bdellovibrionales bacterium]|nr:malate synthase A [Bdellovibrionales bacterium]